MKKEQGQSKGEKGDLFYMAEGASVLFFGFCLLQLQLTQ